jgi:hypothetical protein
LALFSTDNESGLRSVFLTPEEIGQSCETSFLTAVHKLLGDTNSSIYIHQASSLPNEFNQNDHLIHPWLFLFGKGVPSKSSEPKKCVPRETQDVGDKE